MDTTHNQLYCEDSYNNLESASTQPIYLARS